MNAELTGIGDRLRTSRKALGWTLGRLSQESGVSTSNISKIETGVVTPSFDTLLRVARALGMSFEELLGTDGHSGPMGRRAITKLGGGVPFSTGIYDYLVHASELTTKRMIPLAMRIKTRTVPGPELWSSHDGEEFVYVIRGAVELHTEHYAPQGLAEGESAYFDSAMRHAFVSTGEGDAEILSICFTRALPIAAHRTAVHSELAAK